MNTARHALAGRLVVTVLGAVLFALVLSAPAVAQTPATSPSPKVEVGATIGFFKVPGADIKPLSIGPGADVTVWTASGLGVTVGGGYYRGDYAFFTDTTVPILASVLHRVSRNRVRPYLGVGGGIYILRSNNNHDARFNQSSTALGAHGIIGVEPPLAGRARLVVEARFGFFRAPAEGIPDVSYSMGVVALMTGVRF